MSAGGLLLTDDLLFGSRITGTAEALGLRIRTARTATALHALAEQERAACVLLDLHNPGLRIDDAVRQLKQLEPAPFLVGYGSHVDAPTLRAAREAGCDLV